MRDLTEPDKIKPSEVNTMLETLQVSGSVDVFDNDGNLKTTMNIVSLHLQEPEPDGD